MKPKLNLIVLVMLSIHFVNCSSDSEKFEEIFSNEIEPSPDQDVTLKPPENFNLIFPVNNEICQAGEIVTDQSDKLLINFKWNVSLNADSYELIVQDSNSNTEVTKIITSSTNQDVQIDKGRLFQWQVTALNEIGKLASVQWGFYSRGESISNYVPYPAYEIELNFNKTSNTLAVQWQASDEDGDPLSFDIKVFEDGTEVLSQVGLDSNSIKDIPVLLGAKYYIDITVKDGISATTISSSEIIFE